MTAHGDEEQVPGTRSGTPDVFISYASPDSAVAEAACEALEKAGVICWIAPRDVIPGAFYADEIVHAIDDAKVMVLILSQHAAQSPHVLREIERATSKRHSVVSLRIDHAPLPAGLEYFLNTSHWLDATGSDVARSMPKLVSATQVALGAPSVTPAAIPSSRAPASSESPRSPNRVTIVVASLVGLVIAGLAIDLMWVRGRKSVTNFAPIAAVSLPAPATTALVVPEKSVAVLPFVDMSEKKDQEYFSDGLSEELIDMLTKIPDLRVPARTSSFYFKGKQTKISEIAKDLGVAHVLEGSVRRSGNKLRVTAQLIRVDSGYHVWSETYDRTVGDIFRVQDEISAAVVKALQVSLRQPPKAQASLVSNVDAYTLMLQGRFLMRQVGGLESIQKAVRYYEEAQRIEPTAAPIWAGLSRALITEWTYDTAQQAYRERAAKAAERAVALDPASCDAHVALGKVRYWGDWDWAAADAEFKQARALDPQDSYANYFSGELATSLGKLNDALKFYTLAIDQDPLNFSALQSRAPILGMLGRHGDELAAVRKLAELNPDMRGIRSTIAMAELRAGGDPRSALAKIQGEPDEEQRLWTLAWAYATLGRLPDADAAITSYALKYGALQPEAVAGLHATRGTIDAAFEWLDRAYRIRDTSLVDIKVSRTLENIRGTARYQALLRKMNLPT